MGESTRITERLIGQSAVMRRLGEGLRAMAPNDANVLLRGETGTGKGLAARILHDLGPRSASPFVHVDCAALSNTLIESELFGHERGSFTSATHQYAGRFERAGCGTIFLDEIGDLEPRLQAKLLRVLEDREYERVGGTQTLRMRARVIAASSHDLRHAVEERRFRADLFFRLSVLELEMPPLRDRLEDLPALVAHGIRLIASRNGRTPPATNAELIEALRRRPWRGNVRELLNVIERMLVSDRRPVLDASSLKEVRGGRVSDTGTAEVPERPAALSAYALPAEVAEFERREIREALEQSNGNVTAAARRLRIPRGTLRHKLRRYELHGLQCSEAPGNPTPGRVALR